MNDNYFILFTKCRFYAMDTTIFKITIAFDIKI